MREKINESKAEQYAEEMKDGASFPCPVVFYDSKAQRYYVGDGFHRLRASHLNGETTAEVDLRAGTRRDAMLFNISSNRKQRGLPFTLADKRRAIMALLEDEEAKVWTSMKIADFVSATKDTVKRCIDNFQKNGGERPRELIRKNGRTYKVREQHRGSTPDPSIRKRREKAFEMHSSGVLVPEISKELNISIENVRADLKRYRLERQLIECPHCKGSGWIQSTDDPDEQEQSRNGSRKTSGSGCA